MDHFALAARQHGIITREQFDSCGVSRQQRRTLVRNGAVEELLPGVYRMRAAPTTWLQQAQAATLWLPHSAMSHRAAASLRQLRGFDRAPIELITERWARSSSVSGVIIHESKDLRPRDVGEQHGIACTTLVRTLIDLPAVAPPRRCGDALDDALRRHPSLLGQVAHRHYEVARQGRNGTTVMRELLRDRGIGGNLVDSGFERRMLELLALGGLPTPRTQYTVHDGRFRCYLDIAWPDLQVAIECDSLAFHLSERAFRWERKRRRHLNLLGWTILEFTYREMIDEGPLVLRQVRNALAIATARATVPNP